MDRVHVSMDQPGALGPPWTDAGADNGHGGVLTGAWPPAAPVSTSAGQGAGEGEWGAGSAVGGSPGRERRCGGQASRRRGGGRKNSMVRCSGVGEKGGAW